MKQAIYVAMFSIVGQKLSHMDTLHSASTSLTP